MANVTDARAVREKVAALLRALEADDLEERIAPVKCGKHPDHLECGVAAYMVPAYGAPPPDAPGE